MELTKKLCKLDLHALMNRILFSTDKVFLFAYSIYVDPKSFR